MERNLSGAAAASGTSDPHVTLSSCSLHITHVRWLPAVLRPYSTADDAASGCAGASGAAATFLSMRVCRRPAPSHARLLAGKPCTARAALPRVEVVAARTGMLAWRAGAAESPSRAGFIGRRRQNNFKTFEASIRTINLSQEDSKPQAPSPPAWQNEGCSGLFLL